MRNVSLNIDLAEYKPQIVEMKQGDDTVLKVTVDNNSTPVTLTDYDIILNIVRPNNTAILQGDNITTAGNVLTIELNRHAVAHTGNVQFELQFYQNGKIISSYVFGAFVVPALIIGIPDIVAETISKDLYEAVLYALQVRQELTRQTEDSRELYEALSEAIVDVNGKVTAAFDAKTAAETAKTAAEAAKQSVETAAASASQSATNAAGSASAAATAKTAAETAKQSAESARDSAALSETNADKSEKSAANSAKAAEQAATAAVGAVNSAGAVQAERVESAGNTAVNDVNAAAEAKKAEIEQLDLVEEVNQLSDDIAEQRDILHNKKHFYPALEQGTYDENGFGKIDSNIRVRNATPIYVNKKTLRFNIPSGIVVWVYEVDEELNLIGQSTNSMGQNSATYKFDSDYALLVIKWGENETKPITPSDAEGFYIKYYRETVYGDNLLSVPMERGCLASGAYSNSNPYGTRRSAYFIKINGAEKLHVAGMENFAHKYLVVYFYDKDMSYMNYQQTNYDDILFDIPDGCEFIKFYIETYEPIENMSVQLLGATDTPIFVKNVQLKTPCESVVFDTTNSNGLRISNISGFTQGYVRIEDGSIGSDPARVVTKGYVKFDRCENVDITVADGYSVSIVSYTNDGAYVERVATKVNGTVSLAVNNDYKYRFVLVKNDEAEFTPSELPKDALKCEYTIYDFTTSRLMLPPNYSPEGEPVPLILWMDGSGNFTSWDADISAVKTPYLQYLADEGFAVFSVFAWGRYYDEKYPGCGNAYPYVVPTNLNAIKRGLEYICDRFNIASDNVHVMSKSQGGQVATYFVSSPIWDFKSVGMFSPVNDYLSMPGEALYSQTRAAMSEELNFIGDTHYFCSTDFLAYSDKGIAFFEQNKVQLAGMNEAWTNLIGSTLDKNFSSALNDCKTFWTESRWGNSENPDIYNHTSYVKLGRVPVKIWGASDDASTPYGKMAELVAQLQNGGTEAHLRTMPRGTGGHSCADGGSSRTDITTVLGIEHTNVPIGWIENVQWIRSKMPK